MIDSLQSVATLVGLVIDIVGVIMVGHYWLKPVSGGFQRLLRLQTDLNLKWAEEANVALKQLAVERAADAPSWKLFQGELKLALRRMNARIYNTRVKMDRARNGLAPLSVLSADDYWNEAAVRKHHEDMRVHYLDLVKQGAPGSPVPRWGFILIVVGFIFQFFGSLPIS